MSEANQKQVGGEHYKGKRIEPWDYIAANGLDFFEGDIVKYVTRWRQKDGLRDLEKAKHYLEKLIELNTHVFEVPQAKEPKEVLMVTYDLQTGKTSIQREGLYHDKEGVTCARHFIDDEGNVIITGDHRLIPHEVWTALGGRVTEGGEKIVPDHGIIRKTTEPLTNSRGMKIPNSPHTVTGTCRICKRALYTRCTMLGGWALLQALHSHDQ